MLLSSFEFGKNVFNPLRQAAVEADNRLHHIYAVLSKRYVQSGYKRVDLSLSELLRWLSQGTGIDWDRGFSISLDCFLSVSSAYREDNEETNSLWLKEYDDEYPPFMIYRIINERAWELAEL